MELRIRNLSKAYGGLRALQDVSLTIGAGIFGLLGPNGAGKSTLMRILATLQEADAGEATLEDGSGAIDMLHDKAAVRRVLGYLPQEFGLYPRVPARLMLDHFAELKGIRQAAARRALVEALLRQTNLWTARDQRLGTFSGGMKQRFGIAQALIGDPKLIIVDEPTAGLDPEERVRFHNLLSEIGERGIVILSTHIVSDVSELCPAMAILHQGSVLVEGDPVALAASLRGRVWQASVPRAEVAARQQSLMVISSRLSAGRTLIRVLQAESPGPEFTSVEPEVEDVYFAVMRNGSLGVPELPAASSGEPSC
jgi:ABC-type multidrug transport system ATPase subunit